MVSGWFQLWLELNLAVSQRNGTLNLALFLIPLKMLQELFPDTTRAQSPLKHPRHIPEDTASSEEN